MRTRTAKERKRDAAQGSMIHRRSFLVGLATTLLAGTTAARVPIYTLRTTIPAGEVYGRSPMMDTLLPAMREHDEAMQRMLKVWRAPFAAQFNEYADYTE